MLDRRALQLYFRTHAGLIYVVGTVAGCLALCLAFRSSLALASLNGTGTTPLSAAVVAMLGILVGGTWSARAPEQDRLLTRTPSRVRVIHVITATLFTSLAAATTMSVYLGGLGAGLQYFRAALLWSGLGLASAVLAGSAMAWVMPCAYFLVVVGTGYDPNQPKWWNIPYSPIDDPRAWAIAVSVAAGSIVLAARFQHQLMTRDAEGVDRALS